VGEFDLATAPEVDERLEQLRGAGFDRFIVDLRQTSFIDSADIRLAVAWHERSRREQFGFALVHGPKSVRWAFEISGLENTLRFLDTA
jgi:anti-anti-sigma factor